MNRKLAALSLVLALSMIILSACNAAAATEAAATEVPATEAAATEAVATEAAATEAAATEAAAVKYGDVCLGTAESAVVDLNCQEIRIAVENAYLPYNFITKDGQVGGWDYEAWTDICTRLHCTPIFVESAWDGMIESVSNGQFDVGADGVTNTELRREQVDFSIGYQRIEQKLLVRKGETRFTSIEDIVANPELKLGTPTGTTNYETAISYLPEERIAAFDTFPFAVQALLSGDLDAVIMDNTVGMGYLYTNPDELDFIGPAISSDELGFIYPLGSELKAPVDLAIQAMIDDGTMDALMLKFFGPDFTLTYDDIQ